MKESALQFKIIKYLESKNYYVVKVIMANKSGVPDILFCKDGKFCAIEVKAPGKKNNVTELQQHHLYLIQASGGTSLVSDSLTEIKEIF